MLLIETKPEVGQVLGFDYTTSGGWLGKTKKKRLVLVERVDKDGFFGHDFIADGPRNFKFSKIDKAKDFTNKAKVLGYEEIEDGDVDELIHKYESNGCKVYNSEEHELVYVVNV